MSISKFDHRAAKQGQGGFVAILTVMFFILLVSVLTIGFLRIMTDEHDQVIEDDLTKGALAAAESGVEDAKRALGYCRGLASPAAQASCYATLNTTACPGIYDTGAPTDLVTPLQLNRITGDAIQIGDPAINQRTTCTLINLATPDTVGEANDGLADVIPLNGQSTFDSIKVEWHDPAADGTLNAPALAAVNTENLRTGSWQSAGTPYPAMLRLQIIQFTPGNTIAQLSNQNVTTWLVPVNGGASPSVNIPAINPGALTPQRQLVNCGAGTYSCMTTLRIPSINPAGPSKYYLKLSSIYGTPKYRLSLQNGVSAVNFVDAQPSIDVTGAAGDVYRRLVSRVSYTSGSSFYPTTVIESGATVCKDFSLTVTGATLGHPPLCPIP